MPWAVRELLLVAVLGFAASGAGGCFVPTPLQEEGNSGQPYVNLKATTPDVNDPVPVWRGESLFLNLGLADPDSYTLYYRVFLDARYDEVIHEGAVPGCTPTCGAHFEIVGLCDEMVNNVLGIHVLEAYVSDKAFEDNDKKDLRRTAAGGLRDSVLWRIDCQQAVGTVDGGA